MLFFYFKLIFNTIKHNEHKDSLWENKSYKNNNYLSQSHYSKVSKAQQDSDIKNLIKKIYLFITIPTKKQPNW